MVVHTFLNDDCSLLLFVCFGFLIEPKMLCVNSTPSRANEKVFAIYGNEAEKHHREE